MYVSSLVILQDLIANNGQKSLGHFKNAWGAL